MSLTCHLKAGKPPDECIIGGFDLPNRRRRGGKILMFRKIFRDVVNHILKVAKFEAGHCCIADVEGNKQTDERLLFVQRAGNVSAQDSRNESFGAEHLNGAKAFFQFRVIIVGGDNFAVGGGGALQIERQGE